MAHCCEHEAPKLIFDMCFGTDGYWLIASIFITGLVFSFTHCIGMCGPIATAQLSARLLALEGNNMSQKQRIKLALLLPYYLGKGITYIFLAILSYLIAENVAENQYTKGVAIFLITVAGIFFLGNGLQLWWNPSLLKSLTRPITRLSSNIAKLVSFSHENTYGFKGFFLGAMLGFIPCGILYSIMIMIASFSSNLLIAILSAVAFAIATIPGLFIVSYFGSYIIAKWRSAFAIVNSFIMLFNAYLMFSYVHYMIF
jgi:sulfite exporter TauE/SafE